MKKLLLKDQTKGELAFCWEIIRELYKSGYQLALESNLDYFFPAEWFSISKEGDFTIIFTTDKDSEITQKDVFVYKIDKSQDEIELPDLFLVKDTIEKFFQGQNLEGRKILISGGPTAEDIDPVRYITNRSSGKMAIALARAAFIRGGKVTLVLGPIHADIPGYLNIVFIRSAAEMTREVQRYFRTSDIFISAAAVADYTPKNKSKNKIKKKPGNINLELKRTSDILYEVGKIKKKHQFLVGFSLETENLLENSMNKLRNKNLDMIVANNPNEPGSGFNHDTNKITIISKNGDSLPLPLTSKFEAAHKILDQILTYDRNR